MTDVRWSLLIHVIQAVAAMIAITYLAGSHQLTGLEALGGILAAAGVTTLSQLVTNLQLSLGRTLNTSTQAMAANQITPPKD